LLLDPPLFDASLVRAIEADWESGTPVVALGGLAERIAARRVAHGPWMLWRPLPPQSRQPRDPVEPPEGVASRRGRGVLQMIERLGDAVPAEMAQGWRTMDDASRWKWFLQAAGTAAQRLVGAFEEADANRTRRERNPEEVEKLPVERLPRELGLPP